MPNNPRPNPPRDPSHPNYTAFSAGRITILSRHPSGAILIDVAHGGTSHAIRLGRTNWPVRVGDGIAAIAGADVVRWTPVRCGDGDAGDDRPEGMWRLAAEDDSIPLMVGRAKDKGK